MSANPLHLHPGLADRYAKHPSKAVTESLNAAYELGLGNLKAALQDGGKRRPCADLSTATRINDLPVKPVHLLNTAVLARALQLLLPHYYEALGKDERRIVGGFEGVLGQFLRNTYGHLTARAIFKPTEGQTALQASQGYAEDMADLVYECLHELNNNADPRLPFSAMVMLNKLNMVAEVPAETEDAL